MKKTIKDTLTKKRASKLDKIIDETIYILKVAGSSDLFLGIFFILEGISLIAFPAFFPVLIVLSILIAFAWAIEWFFKVVRHRRTFLNILQRILIVIILAALAFYCFLLIFDDFFRINMDRVLVCTTTVADGIKNLINTLKMEDRTAPRTTLTVFSAAYICYGIAYLFFGGSDATFFTTTMHGIVFIFCGLTNVWLSSISPIRKKRNEIRAKRKVRRKISQ